MISNTITIDCSESIKNILCDALRNYIHIKRSHSINLHSSISTNILSTANSIEAAFVVSQQSTFITDDQQQACMAAIHFHYDKIEKDLKTNVDKQRQLMVNLLYGIPVNDQHMLAALHKDTIT